MRKLSDSFMSAKENSQKFSGTFKEYFLETFQLFHVLRRIFLGKIPGYFYFWKKITLFLSCGTRRFMDCKEYLHRNFPVISCLRKKISRTFSGTFMFSKNISQKFSGSFISWKEYFWGTFQYCHASKGIFLGTFPCFFTDEAKNIFMETFRFFHVKLSQKLSITVMLRMECV